MNVARSIAARNPPSPSSCPAAIPPQLGHRLDKEHVREVPRAAGHGDGGRGRLARLERHDAVEKEKRTAVGEICFGVGIKQERLR